MAILHKADLQPTKLDLLAAWLPTQPWYSGDGAPDRVATFRLDDPDGEVGIETFIVGPASGSTGPLFHVPLTYRGAPLAGGRLVGEMNHSVLGHRWAYDGPSDPVYVAVTTRTILDGGREATAQFPDGTVIPPQEWAARVQGTGAGAPRAGAATGALCVARALPSAPPAGAPVLTATWAGRAEETALAWLSD